MAKTETDYFVQILQKRIGEYFNQSLMYEARFQQQNDIITVQNEKITELTRSIEEYQSQIENLDQAKKPTSRRKKVEDGGTF